MELRNKTEEVEILRIEIKDLKKIGELEDQLTATIESVRKEGSNDEVPLPNKDFKKQKHRHRPNPNSQPEPEFNCSECYFQGTSNGELTKHNNEKHRAKQFTPEGSLKCRNCGETFSLKANLMDHRKSEHISTVAQCRNYSNGNCPYSNQMCWWIHADQCESEHSRDSVKCYNCSKTFVTKGGMMTHRKNDHKTVVRDCNQFMDGKCRFKEEACWFNHNAVFDDEDEQENMNNGIKQSVFQKVQENLKPPFQSQNSKKMSQNKHF